MADSDEQGTGTPEGEHPAPEEGGSREGGPDTGTDALAALQAQAELAREQQLRAFAELDNVRKRAARDIEQARKFAIERFAGDLIGVKDSLEMALAAEADGTPPGVLAGVDATLKLLGRAFEAAGISEVVPVGAPFNPELHEAMAAQPTAEQLPDTVVKVVQKGYVLNGRLLRPARVIVARPPA